MTAHYLGLLPDPTQNGNCRSGKAEAQERRANRPARLFAQVRLSAGLGTWSIDSIEALLRQGNITAF